MRFFLFIIVAVICKQQAFAQAQILIPYRIKNNWGYSDTLGNLKISPVFSFATPFNYPTDRSIPVAYAVAYRNSMSEVIDEKGKVVLSGLFDDIEIIYLRTGVNFIVTNKNGKKGLYGLGKQILPCKYDEISHTYNDSYILEKNNLRGLVNASGKSIIPINYENIYSAASDREGKKKWNARKGEEVKTYYDKVISAKSNFEIPEIRLAPALVNPEEIKEWFGIDSSLEIGGGIFAVKDGKKALLPYTTKDSLHFFSKEYTIEAVKDLGKIDQSKFFAKHLLLVVLGNKYGFITENEKIILPLEYDKIEEASGFFVIKSQDKEGFFVTNTIYPVVNPKYDLIVETLAIRINSNWSFGIYRVTQNGKMGFVGENGVEFFKD